jgi:hypothetical protein
MENGPRLWKSSYDTVKEQKNSLNSSKKITGNTVLVKILVEPVSGIY